jgi:hypothetical protein
MVRPKYPASVVRVSRCCQTGIGMGFWWTRNTTILRRRIGHQYWSPKRRQAKFDDSKRTQRELRWSCPTAPAYSLEQVR